jgi:CRP-like cAMP-binding protein
MIEEGALIATKVMEPDTEAVNVYEYKAGMYFGEIALLKDVPR